MLTNKEIVESLESVGYSLEDISIWAKIDLELVEKMKTGQFEEDNNNLNQFFKLNMDEVEISELADEEFRNSHLVLTTNNFVKVNNYKDGGKQHTIKIIFDSFNTIVTDKSQLQTSDNTWITANEVKVGDIVKVFDEEKEITAIEDGGEVECCNIDSNEYYINGVVIK